MEILTQDIRALSRTVVEFDLMVAYRRQPV